MSSGRIRWIGPARRPGRRGDCVAGPELDQTDDRAQRSIQRQQDVHPDGLSFVDYLVDVIPLEEAPVRLDLLPRQLDTYGTDFGTSLRVAPPCVKRGLAQAAGRRSDSPQVALVRPATARQASEAYHQRRGSR